MARFKPSAAYRKIKQLGAISLEMLFVVFSILAIIGIILANVPRIMEAINRMGAEYQLSVLVSNIRASYSQAPSYTGISNAVALSLSDVPSSMGTVAADLTNKFLGKTTIDVDSGTLSGALTVTFSNIPQSSCIAMVNDNAGAIAVEVPASGTWTTTPITDPTTAAGFCPDALNALTWAYR